MNTNSRTTMQQLADAAGVTKATVSLALRNNPRIPVSTCRRIQRIAERLDYRPHPLISTLMSHLRTARPLSNQETIAFLTSYPTRNGWRSWMWDEYFEGAKARAVQLGYQLEEFWLKERGMSGRRASEILQARGIKGLIIAPAPKSHGHLSLDCTAFAVVTLGYTMTRPVFDRVTNHQLHSMTLALRNLKRLGYRQIGFAIAAESDKRVDRGWSAAFYAFQAGIKPADRVPICYPISLDEKSFAKWFDRHRPQVVLTDSPDVANWLPNLGQQIPQDVGFALINWGASRDCAGVNQNTHAIGAAAVDLVDGQLCRNECGIPTIPRVVQIESHWVDGPTVRNLRVAESAPRSRPPVSPRSKRSRGKVNVFSK